MIFAEPAGRSAVGSVLEWGSSGRWFESSRPDERTGLPLRGARFFVFIFGRYGLLLADQSAALTSLSIGMNTAKTMPPMMIPMNTMTIGSMTEVRPLTALSTSVS